MLRHVDVIRSNFYAFSFRTPYTDNTNCVNIVMFIKHVYMQYAAEHNLHTNMHAYMNAHTYVHKYIIHTHTHTYMYKISFGGFEVLSAELLQFPDAQPLVS